MVHDYYAEVEKLSKKKSEKISTGKLFVIIFTLASIVCFCVSIYIGVSGYHFRQNAIPVDAVIVEMADKGDESLEMPLVRYLILCNGKMLWEACPAMIHFWLLPAQSGTQRPSVQN